MRWRINQLFAEKPFEQQQTVPPCTIKNRLASAMTLQAPITGQTFLSMSNGTALYRREPTGLCDDASANSLLQSVSNHRGNGTALYNRELPGLCDDASGN